ncbi:MAG: hypothetical protein U0670_16425 [Anaerolineae bacterium]
MPIFNQTRLVELTPTITAGAYSAGDVIGGLLAFDVFSPGGGGSIRRITLIDADDEKAPLKLYLFSSAPGSLADNAAFVLPTADLRKLIDVVTVSASDYASLNGDAYAVKRDLEVDYPNTNGKLYAYLVCDGTPTYGATNDLTVRLTLWAD